MHVGDGHVVDRLDAVGFDRLDRGHERLAIRPAHVGAEQGRKPLLLGVVGKADRLGVPAQVLATDDQLVDGLLRVAALTSASVRHQGGAGPSPLSIDRAGDAESQQHALRGLQHRAVDLGQTDADPLGLAALHRTVSIEQASQQPAAEIGRGRLHRRGDRLVARPGPQIERQVAQSCRGQAALPTLHLATRHGALPTPKVGPVRQRLDRAVNRRHDAGNARRHRRHVAAHHAELGSPDRQDRFAGAQASIADQGPNQVALVLRVRTVPPLDPAMVVQHHFVTRLQGAGRAPVGVRQVTGAARHAAHRVIGSEPQSVAFTGAQAQQGLHAGREEAFGLGRPRLAVDERREAPADQVAHLPGSVSRGHPGVGGHARIRRRDRLAVREVVVAVDRVDEQHARLGVVVGRAHDRVPQVARLQAPVDPQAVAAAERARRLQVGCRLGAVHEVEVAVGLDRLHEGVGHADREVEVAQVARVLGVDEGLDVRVVDPQHAHLRAAPRAGRLDRLARAVEHAQVADRAAGAAGGAVHPGPARADAREVVAHAAAAAHRLGGLGQGRVDARETVVDLDDRVADRLHEAVDQRGLEFRACGRLDAPGRDEARAQGVEETRLPMRAAIRGLDRGERARHAPCHVVSAALVPLGVLLEQDLGADGLGRQVVGRGWHGSRRGRKRRQGDHRVGGSGGVHARSLRRWRSRWASPRRSRARDPLDS